MSETPDSTRPGDDEGQDAGATRPPYPGWSAQQPPGSGRPEQASEQTDTPDHGSPEQGTGWTAPGGQRTPGWTTRGQASGWTVPGASPDSGPIAPGQQNADWARPGGPQQPSGPSGWGQSGLEPSGTTPRGDWGGSPSWGWRPPTVKPGVIPLRPLGVGEILDGAVTTIRRNPGPMLGLSAVVAIIVQLTGLAAAWAIFRNIEALDTLPETATAAEVLGATAGIFGSAGIIVVVDWLATVVLTGILTVVVGRAVLGQHLTVAEAWQRARRRLLRLLLLTIVYALIWLSPLIITAVAITLLAAAGAGDAAAGVGILMTLAALPVAVWLYVRYALAAPALMLESTPGRAHHAGGEPRPIGIGMSLRRSGELVTRSWWRVFGILLLVWLVAFIITQVIGVLFSVPSFFLGDPTEQGTALTFGVLAVAALGGIVSTTITAPFRAGAVALLYVDRRIRREALDIELAQAAGVTIPGRTEPPPTS